MSDDDINRLAERILEVVRESGLSHEQITTVLGLVAVALAGDEANREMTDEGMRQTGHDPDAKRH